MEEKGLVGVSWGDENHEVFLDTAGKPGLALEDVAMTLKAMLDETAAYRAYLRSVDKDVIISQA